METHTLTHMERDLITFPTWERYTVLAAKVRDLSMKEKRVIFQVLREDPNPSGDLLFPEYGFTLSEFSVWHVLGECRRKSNSTKRSSTTEENTLS